MLRFPFSVLTLLQLVETCDEPYASFARTTMQLCSFFVMSGLAFHVMSAVEKLGCELILFTSFLSLHLAPGCSCHLQCENVPSMYQGIVFSLGLHFVCIVCVLYGITRVDRETICRVFFFAARMFRTPRLRMALFNPLDSFCNTPNV